MVADRALGEMQGGRDLGGGRAGAAAARTSRSRGGERVVALAERGDREARIDDALAAHGAADRARASSVAGASFSRNPDAPLSIAFRR